FILLIPPPPSSPLFPYTTLFRSVGFGALLDMIARTAFTQLNCSLLRLVGTLVGLLLTFVAPVALTFSTNSKIWLPALLAWCLMADRKSTRLNSSHRTISYAVFCL